MSSTCASLLSWCSSSQPTLVISAKASQSFLKVTSIQACTHAKKSEVTQELFFIANLLNYPFFYLLCLVSIFMKLNHDIISKINWEIQCSPKKRYILRLEQTAPIMPPRLSYPLCKGPTKRQKCGIHLSVSWTWHNYLSFFSSVILILYGTFWYFLVIFGNLWYCLVLFNAWSYDTKFEK